MYFDWWTACQPDQFSCIDFLIKPWYADPSRLNLIQDSSENRVWDLMNSFFIDLENQKHELGPFNMLVVCSRKQSG